MIFTVAMYRAQHDRTAIDAWFDMNIRGWRDQVITEIETLGDSSLVKVTKAHLQRPTDRPHPVGLCPEVPYDAVGGDPHSICLVRRSIPCATRFPADALDADALAATE